MVYFESLAMMNLRTGAVIAFPIALEGINAIVALAKAATSFNASL